MSSDDLTGGLPQTQLIRAAAAIGLGLVAASAIVSLYPGLDNAVMVIGSVLVLVAVLSEVTRTDVE